ncbi:hypothetical protein H0H87_007572, partial [Tephrocybe sp. NHM501043]
MDEDNDKATDLGLGSEGKDNNQDQDQEMEDSDVNVPEALAHGSNFPSPTLSLAKLPILTLPSFHQWCHHQAPFELDPEMPPFLQLAQAMLRIQTLEGQVRDLKNKVNQTVTHCTMASKQIGKLKKIINAKNTWKPRGTMVTLKSCWIMSSKDLVEFNKQLAAQKAKKKKQAEAKSKWKALMAKKQAERDARGPTQVFQGFLGPKNKDNLMEIITALVISMEAGKKFRKDELVGLIQVHLDAHSELKEHPCFAGLFGGGQQQQGHAEKENHPPTVNAVTSAA